MNGKNVVRFPGVTRLDIAPDQILQEAIGQLEGVVIAGFGKDGEHYFASSYAAGGETLWLLEACKKRLMEIGTDDR
jgi:hypothetical protein